MEWRRRRRRQLSVATPHPRLIPAASTVLLGSRLEPAPAYTPLPTTGRQRYAEPPLNHLTLPLPPATLFAFILPPECLCSSRRSVDLPQALPYLKTNITLKFKVVKSFLFCLFAVVYIYTCVSVSYPGRQSVPGLLNQSLVWSEHAVLLSGLNAGLHLSPPALILHTVMLKDLRNDKTGLQTEQDTLRFGIK